MRPISFSLSPTTFSRIAPARLRLLCLLPVFGFPYAKVYKWFESRTKYRAFDLAVTPARATCWNEIPTSAFVRSIIFTR